MKKEMSDSRLISLTGALFVFMIVLGDKLSTLY